MLVKCDMPDDPRFQNLTGKKFGRLKVLEYFGAKRTASRSSHQWLCKCKCGRTVVVFGGNLRRKSKSCGCRAAELSSKRLTTHGCSAHRTREYRAWCAMYKRCYNKSYDHYHLYGGRGIKVCKRWLGQNGFENFLDDMGKCPAGMTLERKNTNGNYTSKNCKWATVKEQSRNRRSNRLITYAGRTQCLIAWAEELGMDRGTLSYRLARWPLDRAMTP